MKTPIRHSIRFAIATAAALSVALPATASAAGAPAGTGSRSDVPAAKTTQPSAATKTVLRKQADAITSRTLNGSSESLRSSFTTSNTGRPGGLTVYRVQGSHMRPCSAWYCLWNPVISIFGPVIYRSPATAGAQGVMVRYVVQRYTPGFGWRNLIVQDRFATIWAGQSGVRMGQERWYPNPQQGHLRVIKVFVWASGGTTLGGRLVNMNHQSDYECATRMQTCYTGPGWIYLRGPA